MHMKFESTAQVSIMTHGPLFFVGGPARPKFNEYFKGPSYKILRKQ